jgi:Ca2+-binding RTX toxin-like protein
MSLLLSATMLAGSFLVPAVATAAPAPVNVGNDLVARRFATDGATGVFGLVTGNPLPAGTLNQFRIWNQAGPDELGNASAGKVFHAYVLRPVTGTNKYTVAFDSGALTVPALSGGAGPTGEVVTFTTAAFTVQPGDLIGWYGQGIPLDIDTGTDTIAFPGPATAPAAGTTFTLGLGAFPVYPQARAYSIAATITPTAQIVGQGFVVTPADLAFILKQIRIAERHSVAYLSGTNPDPVGDPAYCQSMIGPDPDQVATPLLSFGLRTVDGQCNNLQPGQADIGAADEPFPRLTVPSFRGAESNPPLFGPPGPPTSYAQTTGNVFDSQPRIISNLIVDQTSSNPSAVAAAGDPFRDQGNGGVVPCDGNGQPVGCVPAHETLDIPNVTTDVGLSPPFNTLFTIFGQFFDHGLDKITNGGSGTVFVPLRDDDPLVAGPNHIFGDADDLSPNLRFMVLTRGTIVTGPDGFRSAPNTDTPFVDQSQTYTSHASHQVFTREYVNNTAGRPVSTGKFLSSPDGGLPTWAMVKAQAATLLGLQLANTNVGNIPMIKADPYGNFVPGPDRGLPQYVTASGLVEGNTAAPVPVPANAFFINTAFLNDIAHSAAPTAGGPDADLTAGGSLDTPSPAGTYDDELLDIHAICGDGRCNENIALQSVHQIFHNEHDRLIDYIKGVISNDGSGVTHLADWQDAAGAAGWNGKRLFQAARFVTEMEYQHLVFEEFARKVQPGINPFEPFAFNQTDVNPAITAEFAHAVYRFGHSMLTDTIPRINTNGTHNDIPLLDAFLNPAAFHDGGPVGTLSSQEAAGSILMGISDQAGQGIDEFVVETLRNHLLGLPLDLPSINMTRARSEGIPTLNNVRKQVFAANNDGQMQPYPHWVGFGEGLKHHTSLVNFVAAYGKHPTITAATTLEAKRTAADQIVNGTVLAGADNTFGIDCGTLDATPACADDVFPPEDSGDFMFSTGAWANTSADVSITGVDDIDLWMGGLAERTNLFGGLLGSTFNYVFEKQLTDLQNGDRFYYLARTPGMNLRTQLEGNSFSELVMRNTNAHTLKADPFATADCKFELGHLTWPAVAGSFITGAGSVNDDALSECNENRLLLRNPDGTFQYRALNSVDPPGINGQSVYNGAAGDVVDRVFGGNDSDTFWGGLGNDRIEGNDGADVALGGEGNDIITDLAGDDVQKGGPGNDAMDGGPGLDLLMGAEGNDFTNGGANTNETFGGDGDDFAIAGQGADAVFGDSGNDWEEGGDQPDLLIGDSSTLFFDDHNLPGHDILIGQGGDDDYDMEGGDDIGVAGPGVEKNAGASGYDWITGQGDPQPQNADLALLIVNAPPVNETRDRYNEVEALSGWQFNDILRGDDVIPSQVGGGGFIGCDALDQAGLDRIAGLDALVPPLTVPTASVVANSATNFCLLTGDNVWGEGNILLGGAGSDTLEGRGADDILDGDQYLGVRLSIRTNPSSPATEIGSTDLMEHAALSGTFGAGTSGKTLQQAVFAGLVDPGNIVAVREILDPGAGSNVDVAVFSGPLANYDVVFNGDGSVTVSDAATVAVDGTDLLWNVEQLSFCDVPGIVPGTCDVRAPLITLPPVAVVAPASLAFGSATVGSTTPTQAVTVTNNGFTPLVVSAVSLTGADSSQFAVASNGCATVAPAVSCTINVQFAPTAAGDKSASLSITHNGIGAPLGAASPVLVTLTGTGAVNSPAGGTVTIDVTTPTEDQLLTATQAITDANGVGTITLTWQSATTVAGPWTPVGTGATFTPGDAQVGLVLRVVGTFTDGAGNPESVASAATAAVANVNDPAVGVPTLSQTLPQENELITASTVGISDADGLVGVVFSFQWQQNPGTGFVNIPGATSATFTPVQAQVGSTLRVRVTYTDNRGGASGNLLSAATGVTGDVIVGTAADETLTGTAGRDNVSGLGGADNISTLGADDIASGGAGADTIATGAGNDIASGDGGADTISTGADNDTIRFNGTDGVDDVTGGAGTDTIVALSNNTVIGLSALAGVESITADAFTGVTIVGSAAANTLNFSAVTLTGIVSIDGAGGADSITGSTLADTILGGAGNDSIAGGGGVDSITGGLGNDALNGNAGNDFFRVVPEGGFGADTITGFDAAPAGGQDLIDISALGITAANFGANVTRTAQGGNTLITIAGPNGGTILLVGVAVAAIGGNGADFVLAP